jgi:hypothetical protein
LNCNLPIKLDGIYICFEYGAQSSGITVTSSRSLFPDGFCVPVETAFFKIYKNLSKDWVLTGVVFVYYGFNAFDVDACSDNLVTRGIGLATF